jgi:hypothetical protein
MQHNPPLQYGVFISHSGKDPELLKRTRTIIEITGALPFFSTPGSRPGSDVDPTTRAMIDDCVGVVVLLTENGCQSQSVNQEIGYVKKGNKPILPILFEGQKMPGIFLHGTEPLPLPDDSWESVIKIGQALLQLQWNPANTVLSDLGAIYQEITDGEPPFRCHKGHWPGPPCDQAVGLYKEQNRYVLRHWEHQWEVVYVSDSTARFLSKYILRKDLLQS